MVGDHSPSERTASAEHRKVWVRRCLSCRLNDLHAAFGLGVLVDDLPWRCPECGWDAWTAVLLDLPDDPPATGCPFGGDDRS